MKALLATLVMAAALSPARAQSPPPPPVAEDVAQIKRDVADLRAAVARIEARLTPTLQSVPTVAAATVSYQPLHVHVTRAPAVAQTRPTEWPAASPTPAAWSVTEATTALTYYPTAAPAPDIRTYGPTVSVAVGTPTPAPNAAGRGPIRRTVRQFFGGT